MPRVYKPVPGKKRYRKYTEDALKSAIQEYFNTGKLLSEISKKYDINKSVLYRHATKIQKKPGGQTVLSAEVEMTIITYLNVCAEWGYPLDALDLRFIVKMYLDKLDIKQNRFKNNMPGPDFVNGFLNRHKDKIAQRICQNIKRTRAAIGPNTINSYFEELRISLKDVPIGNILNYDETNLSDDPGRRKIITKRGTKYPERVMNHSKASVSLMMAGTADGQLLPPYVVYKSEGLYDTWVTNGPKGARYNRSASGWFDGEIFEDWIRTIVIPFFSKTEGKKLLIGDNLSSHLSVHMIKLCQEHNIKFVFLPANSTHLTQPLDVAFFRPMKAAWRKILLQWKKSDGRKETCIPKGCFPKLLKLLMNEMEENAAANLITAFRKTGINPLNPDEVLSRLPNETHDSRYKDAVDESILKLLSEMRYGTMSIKPPGRKRKLLVVAGRSVSEDYDKNLEVASTSAPVKQKKSSENQIISNLTEKSMHQETKKGKGVGKKTVKKTNDTEQLKQFPEDNLESSTSHIAEIMKKCKEVGKKTVKKAYIKQLKQIPEDNLIETSTSQINKTMILKKSIQITEEKYSEKNSAIGSEVLEGNRLNKDKNEKISDLEGTQKAESIITEEDKENKTEPRNKEHDMQLLKPQEQAEIEQIEKLFNIDELPVYFQDSYIVGEEIICDDSSFTDYVKFNDDEIPIEVKNKETKENKIKVLSNVKFDSDKKCFTGKMVKISPKTVITLNKQKEHKATTKRRPSYIYKNNEEILKDLMNDGVI